MNNKFNKILLAQKNIYISINAKDYNSENDLLNKVAEKLNNGADILEFRGNNLSSSKFLSVALKLRELTALFNSLLIIYDRIDIAKLVKADGILLDKNSIDIFQAKKLIENDYLTGFYCDNKEDALYAQEQHYDFIVSKEQFNEITIKNYII